LDNPAIVQWVKLGMDMLTGDLITDLQEQENAFQPILAGN
jgi:hypothetical protein